MLKYYLFTAIPAAGKGWTLAVLAVNRSDALQYVKSHNGGGRLVCTIDNRGATGVPVKADCGAVTSTAAAEIRNKLESPILPAPDW